MQWDRKRLSGYVETIQLILAMTDKYKILIQLIAAKFSDIE